LAFTVERACIVRDNNAEAFEQMWIGGIEVTCARTQSAVRLIGPGSVDGVMREGRHGVLLTPVFTAAQPLADAHES